MLITRRSLLTAGFVVPPLSHLVAAATTHTSNASAPQLMPSREIQMLVSLLREGARCRTRDANYTGRYYSLGYMPDLQTKEVPPAGKTFFFSTINNTYPRTGPLDRNEMNRVWMIIEGMSEGTPHCPIRSNHGCGDYMVWFSIEISKCDLITYADRMSELVLNHDVAYKCLAATLPTPNGKILT